VSTKPAPAIQTSGIIGADVPRVDALPKVTGAALYGADFRLDGAAYAHLVTSPIAKGKIRQIDETAARATPDVVEILTYQNVGKAIKAGKAMLDGGHMGSSVAPLGSDRIHFAGQIVAVVIAQTLEAAAQGAASLSIEYDAQSPTATFDSPGATEVKPNAIGETELEAGNFARAFAAAAATVDAWYQTPPQHHNPMELFQTTCAWDADHLTVWESSQSVRGYQHGLAKQLGIKPAQIRVISPFVGGAFGSRGELAQSTALIALAAKRLGRPVKLVATRTQGFTLRTFRAETRHHVQLGAAADGRLTALSHEAWELTSRDDRFALAGIESTARLYACPNIQAHVHNVQADRQTPGFMRAPPEVPYMFAMESAMDELAYELKIDPLELRKRNDTMHEPIKGLPYTSRSLLQCYDAAADAFGWARRDARPGSMRDGDWLIGWGCATAFYPAQIAPATCRVTLASDARATVEIGTHDIGTGTYTVVAQTAADFLGVPLQNVIVLIGDSALPAAPLSAGSSATASTCTVVAKACQMLRSRLARAAVKPKHSPLHGIDPDAIQLRDSQLVSPDGRAEPLAQSVQRLGRGQAIVVNASNNPDGAPPLIGPSLIAKGMPVIVGGVQSKNLQYAFGAQFVEVRIHRLTGQIRASRLVGAFAAGRIMNARTARSQLMGGQVWGLSSALHEATEIDHRTARYVNDNLADYLVPVAPDIGQVTTILIPEEDTVVNPLGIKGVGELGTVGLNAAVANAVFHATAVRIRQLPIRIEKLLQSDLMKISAAPPI
jgi:xanthine dehydrogenase YagR molybdenum-binding subunit